MAARGRSYGQSNGWNDDDDYNTTTYDAQYPDDDTSGGVNLDHCRLYIKNIPRYLNEEGLRKAFSKFGTLVECHLSKDPNKHYGLIKYETQGEATLAMMKMNKTEPLQLSINVAHKSKAVDKPNHNRDRQDRSGGYRDRNNHRNQSHYDLDESASYGSRGKNSRQM